MNSDSISTKIKHAAFSNVPQEIRERMSRIRKANTKPELLVRSLTHRMGFRFRLHRRDLPGTPDLTFPSLGKVIFVHGCFWHRHNCKLSGKVPAIREDYWHPKLQRNVERDKESIDRLLEIGWEALVIWECETKDLTTLQQKIGSYLTKQGNRQSSELGALWCEEVHHD